MKRLLALFGSLVLFAVAAFRAFGFLATFETSDTPGEILVFRIGYVVVGLGCVAGLIALIVKAVRHRS